MQKTMHWFKSYTFFGKVWFFYCYFQIKSIIILIYIKWEKLGPKTPQCLTFTTISQVKSLHGLPFQL